MFGSGGRPEIVIGADGLPHCAVCLRRAAGSCAYHMREITMALNSLKTGSRLQSMAPLTPFAKETAIDKREDS